MDRVAPTRALPSSAARVGPVDYEPVTELSSPPIGIGLLPTGRRQTSVRLPAGCQVASTPTAFIEAQVDGELLGRDRLAKMMAGLETERAAQSLIDAVHAEADDASDDMAACVFATDVRAAGAGQRLEGREVDVMTLDDRSLERFLEAWRVSADEIPASISRAHAVAADSETAVLRMAIDHGRAVAEVQSAAVPALVAA